MRDDRELLALIAAAEREHAGKPVATLAAGAEQEPPMPIPSTWLLPPREETTSWGARQLLAAGLGLGLGLLVVVPALIWSIPYAALPGHPALEAATASRNASSGGSQQLVAVASTQSDWQGRLSTAYPPAVIAASTDGPDEPETAILLARSELLASSGDLAGARELLRQGADAERAVILFALAETHDPNMLAAWGLRVQQADPAEARALYARAREKGHPRAGARIEALR